MGYNVLVCPFKLFRKHTESHTKKDLWTAQVNSLENAERR